MTSDPVFDRFIEIVAIPILLLCIGADWVGVVLYLVLTLSYDFCSKEVWWLCFFVVVILTA